MTNQQAERWRVRRDAIIVMVSLAFLGGEIFLLGGRAHVITALVGLLVVPAALRVDEARRQAK